MWNILKKKIKCMRSYYKYTKKVETVMNKTNSPR